jgi:hypothetical protein
MFKPKNYVPSTSKFKAMKKFFFLVLISCISVGAFSQETKKQPLKFDKTQEVHVVDAACGTCMLKMAGKDCKLAITFKGKNYFVDGTGIDDHGDAHDDAGFCNAISKAKVQGKVVDDKFLVTYFELVKKVK